ncbi:MAG TPA: flagellar export protein FliJ [Treponema sp.]|nr:flagellar export protein FliJ [Treponema sp.]HBD67841.1 flagellar export protein FliJ [Treponema sp.]
MKKFVFSMQKILDLRAFEQSQAELELGKVNAEIARIQNELNAIAASRVSVTKSTDAVSGDFSLYAQTQNYFAFLDRRQEELFEQMAQAQLLAEQKREVVREAMKKVKVLEKLRETKLSQWKKERLDQEEKAMDDVVTAAFNER